MILHIPHSSTVIPKTEGYIVDQDKINNELIKLTDWYTDDLFDVSQAIKIITPFSRIFCDVERFRSDIDEPMSKFGMGALYTKCDDGSKLRAINSNLKREILNNYYDLHHTNFTSAVERELKLNGKSLIIDCHSFPNEPLNASLIKDGFRPDINIGTDSYHTPKELVDFTENYFNSKGYSVGIDKPYTGSIVPLTYYKKEKSVESIMIEVNRKLYLEGSTNRKSNNYNLIKRYITEYLNTIK